MQKNYTSLGLMSGTSGDCVDASILYSNGIDEFEVIKDKYFEYDAEIYKDIHSLKEKINNIEHLKIYFPMGSKISLIILLVHSIVYSLLITFCI